MGNSRALFLDCDGVIFDSYGIWDEVVSQLLSSHGKVYTEAIKSNLWHLSMTQADHFLYELLKDEVTREAYQSQKEELLEKAYAQVPLIAGVDELFEWLADEGLSCYAVTANQTKLVEIAFQSHGLTTHIKGIYSCYQTQWQEKEAAFLQTILDREKLVAEEVIMVEDSWANAKQAEQLGIQTFFLENEIYQADQKNGSAIRSIKHLSDFISIMEDN
ncbi:HAD family hydrolase [Streptococcus saliviloxodontae]|uniref:Phosphoglycolate phosphatase-like HAD superfamily hydrolase n=1 Tax=Streptococcus saliviloxodontae TaxID=1349416 RepID=A0ABS2PNH9_9STRE|nr:HAD hydrolase-like protein [Streptococcus saliviloxodontae]MBM7636501.1 phosphoglycolate phosphatase-like HAD superfamily hydrolase [Streptococcus saliviloxodontae]